MLDVGRDYHEFDLVDREAAVLGLGAGGEERQRGRVLHVGNRGRATLGVSCWRQAGAHGTGIVGQEGM